VGGLSRIGAFMVKPLSSLVGVHDRGGVIGILGGTGKRPLIENATTPTRNNVVCARVF